MDRTKVRSCRGECMGLSRLGYSGMDHINYRSRRCSGHVGLRLPIKVQRVSFLNRKRTYFCVTRHG